MEDNLCFIFEYLELFELLDHERGAGGSGATRSHSTGQQEANQISKHFQDDALPRVGGLDANLLSYFRVGNDLYDLLFYEFDLHINWF
jgi:hypothetical protein